MLLNTLQQMEGPTTKNYLVQTSIMIHLRSVAYIHRYDIFCTIGGNLGGGSWILLKSVCLQMKTLRIEGFFCFYL